MNEYLLVCQECGEEFQPDPGETSKAFAAILLAHVGECEGGAFMVEKVWG